MSWQFDFLVRVLHNLSSEKRTRDSLNRFLLRLRMILMRGNDGARGVFCVVLDRHLRRNTEQRMTRGEILLN